MFSKQIDFIYKKKFLIFKINNFLPNDLYEELNHCFPKEINDRPKTFGKSYLASYDKGLEDLLKYKSCNKLNNLIMSEEFFKFFTSKLYLDVAFSQNNFIKKLKYLRPASKNKNIIFNFLFSKIRVEYDFSIITNNGGIVPHSDAQRKYLSLMIYFPDKNYHDRDYGTSFWDCKSPNYTNTHIEDKEEIIRFKKQNKLILKTPFISNCLFGFIRNNYSWHSVEPLDINKSYARRSININFFYDN